jgi:heme ABC exporter ATP-binding subunit CcmA
MISLEKLRVVYGKTVALRELSIDLFEGITGVFGPNGAGKSTLLRVLAGMLAPTSGAVTLDDRSLSISDESVRRRIGYAGHASGLYARLTVRENLQFFASLYGVPDERIDFLLEQIGMSDRAKVSVGRLSAGLKRRASVARALLHEPDLLLLDEPYANLDDEAADLIGSAVRDWRRPGRIALIATHGAKRVKAFADAGLIMKNGSVVSYRLRSPGGRR